MMELYFCVMCPDSGDPWVGDFDITETLGECPKCHYSVGIFAVESDGFPQNETTRQRIAAVVKAGNVARRVARPATP